MGVIGEATEARVTVGIPRTLLYYTYFPLWRRFFEELGVEVVTSAKTTKRILDDGVRTAVTDACVPIKLIHGHVVDLIGRVNYLFLPRVVCTNGRTVYCPKFLGLPDMIRSSISELPTVIDVRFDVRRGRLELIRAALQVGRVLNKKRLQVLRALRAALGESRRYSELVRAGMEPETAMAQAAEGKSQGRGCARFRSPDPLDGSGRGSGGRREEELRFAVIGYPYAVYDSYISLNLLGKLRQLGVTPVTAQMVSPRDLAAQDGKLGKDLFWTYSDEAIRAAFYFLDHPELVDGLIHLTAFGCGPDSMVDKMIELMAKKSQSVPFMSLMIDEQTGEAGLLTRLEAFTDMVRRQKRARGE